jgi:hypothetical protein
LVDEGAVATEPKRPERRVVQVEDLADEEMALIERAKVPLEHDYDYADDPDPPEPGSRARHG